MDDDELTTDGQDEHATPQGKTLQEVHDDIEAALFAVNDLDGVEFDGGPRLKALIATNLEQAFLWTKRAMELAGVAPGD